MQCITGYVNNIIFKNTATAQAQEFSCTFPLMDPNSETPQLTSPPATLTLFPSLNTSQCGGTVEGYEFCSQYMRNTGMNRGTIFTLLVLEDVGSSYTVLRETTFMEVPHGQSGCQGVNDGGVCCTTISLDLSEQFAATSPNLSYATITPIAADGLGNFLLDFDEKTSAYVRDATHNFYTFGSSSVTKTQLDITDSSQLTSVRRKRFRFLIEESQPSVSAMVRHFTVT